VASAFRRKELMPVITYLEAIRQALFDEMARDERVFVLGEDVGAYGGAFKVTEGLIDRFGEDRVIDTPISEAAIVGSAIGASYMGMRPVCEIQFIDFIACCFDMLTNFAATSRYRNGAGVPIVVRGPCGGGVSGGPFHSLNPEAFFLNTPGLKMVEPSTAYDAKGLLKAAIRDDDPVLYFEHKYLYRRIKDEVPDEDYVVPLGKAAVRREGKDLSIITFGAMVHTALDAAAKLAEEGVETEVLDLRSLAPLDREAILETVGKTSKVLLLHEATRTGGIGGELAAIIAEEAFEYLDAPVMRLASLDSPVPYAPQLEAAFLPNAEKVVAAAKKLVEY
jgi:2-oxoisovalerate dehydrogenase E1 component beta subunit